jgi:hypothetical protein
MAVTPAPTVAGTILGPDTHANRPAADASGLPVGAVFVCSDHDTAYQTDGSTWTELIDFSDRTPAGVSTYLYQTFK